MDFPRSTWICHTTPTGEQGSFNSVLGGFSKWVVKGTGDNEPKRFLTPLKILSGVLQGFVSLKALRAILNEPFASSLQPRCLWRSSWTRLRPLDSAWHSHAGQQLSPPCTSPGSEVTLPFPQSPWQKRSSQPPQGCRESFKHSWQGTYLCHLLLCRWDPRAEQQQDPHLIHAQTLPAVNDSLCSCWGFWYLHLCGHKLSGLSIHLLCHKKSRWEKE